MPFQTGTSGNSKGRPKGRTASAKIRAAIEKRANDVLETVINAAISGDLVACKLLLDRIAPTLKPQTMAINLPIQDSLSGQGNEIIRATMAGEVPPDVGNQLMAALSLQCKILETCELVARIEAQESA